MRRLIFSRRLVGRERRAGFSMVELLVVATVMTLLVAAGMVSYVTLGKNSRNARRQSDLEQFRAAMEVARTELGLYPTGTFSTVVQGLSAQGFLSGQPLVDPKNVAPYQYSLNQGGSYTSCPASKSYEVCAALEPDGTAYCLCNP